MTEAFVLFCKDTILRIVGLGELFIINWGISFVFLISIITGLYLIKKNNLKIKTYIWKHLIFMVIALLCISGLGELFLMTDNKIVTSIIFGIIIIALLDYIFLCITSKGMRIFVFGLFGFLMVAICAISLESVLHVVGDAI